MKESEVRDIICEMCPDENFLFADGFDAAVIGICTKTYRVVYSRVKCIEILSKDMDYEDAVEHFDFNVDGSYMGEKTPIFVDDTLFQS